LGKRREIQKGEEEEAFEKIYLWKEQRFREQLRVSLMFCDNESLSDLDFFQVEGYCCKRENM